MPPRGSGAPRDPSHYRSPPRKSHQPAAPGTGEADPKLCPGILGGLITNRRRPSSTPKKPSDFYPLCFSNIQLYEPRDVSGTLHQQAIITTPFCAHFLQNSVSRLLFPPQPGNALHTKKVNVIFHASSSCREGVVKAKARAGGAAEAAACSWGAGVGAAPRQALSWELVHT